MKDNWPAIRSFEDSLRIDDLVVGKSYNVIIRDCCVEAFIHAGRLVGVFADEDHVTFENVSFSYLQYHASFEEVEG
jgi:hypothetical protein